MQNGEEYRKQGRQVLSPRRPWEYPTIPACKSVTPVRVLMCRTLYESNPGIIVMAIIDRNIQKTPCPCIFPHPSGAGHPRSVRGVKMLFQPIPGGGRDLPPVIRTIGRRDSRYMWVAPDGWPIPISLIIARHYYDASSPCLRHEQGPCLIEGGISWTIQPLDQGDAGSVQPDS